MQRAVTPGLLAALLVAGSKHSSSSSTSNGSTAAGLEPTYNIDVEELLLPLFLAYCHQHYK